MWSRQRWTWIYVKMVKCRVKPSIQFHIVYKWINVLSAVYGIINCDYLFISRFGWTLLSPSFRSDDGEQWRKQLSTKKKNNKNKTASHSHGRSVRLDSLQFNITYICSILLRCTQPIWPRHTTTRRYGFRSARGFSCIRLLLRLVVRLHCRPSSSRLWLEHIEMGSNSSGQ